MLLGPAYTTYKLFTVVNLARVLEDELGVPVTPVFWVESEDHDWDEVNRFFWKGRKLPHRGAEVRARDSDRRRRPRIRPRFSLRWRTLIARTTNVPPRRGISSRRQANDRSEWHVRNLARLVPDVVYLEPRLLREPMRPLAEQIASA